MSVKLVLQALGLYHYLGILCRRYGNLVAELVFPMVFPPGYAMDIGLWERIGLVLFISLACQYPFVKRKFGIFAIASNKQLRA